MSQTTRLPRPTSVRPRPVRELAALLGVPAPESAISVTGISHVAQAVLPGDLYVARAGARAHGADFADVAVRCGAVAVLTDAAGAARVSTVRSDSGAEPASPVPVLTVPDPAEVLGPVSSWVYGDPSAALTLIGVTGTNGKTTTAYLLESGLRAAGQRTGLIGTVETLIDGTAVPSARTTPEAPELQGLFASMVERGVTAAAMEVSSHALALRRVDGTAFAAGLFTNLSQDHLDFHADMEDYFAAKARLFDGRAAVEVVNIDDAWGRRLARPSTVTVSAFGEPAATWRAERLCARDGGSTAFTAVGPDGLRVEVTLDLAGSFNAGNALQALAAIHACGLDPIAAAEGMRHTAVPGRLERIEAGQDFLAFVDYAHKPGAVAAILQALRPLTKGSLIIVLGAGGDRDRSKRPLMGQAAGRGADLVIVTDDNPRTEDPAQIRAEIAAGAGPDAVIVPGRRAAIAEAVRRARAGDTVVIAGKGHEQGQEIGTEVRPFDDRVVLREIIGGAR